MKAERATEMWKMPPLPKVPATPSNKFATPASKRPPLTIVTPATSKKRTLNNPAEFTFNVGYTAWHLLHVLYAITLWNKIL